MAIDPRLSLAGQVTDVAGNVTSGLANLNTIRTQGVREQILNQQAQSGAMQNAQVQGAYVNQLATSLLNKPLDERAAIVAQQLPLLSQMGIDPQKIIGGNLSDQGLQGVITQTQPFAATTDAGRPFEIDGNLVSPTGEVLFSVGQGGAGGAPIDDPTGGKGYTDIKRDDQTGTVTGLNKLTNKIEVIPQGEAATKALTDIAQREELAAADQAELESQGVMFGQTQTLRKELETNIKPYVSQLDAFNSIEGVLKADEQVISQFADNMELYADDGVDVERLVNDSQAISDIALIFGFFKAVDPTSTVREGEFATLETAGGGFTRFGNLYNKLLSGGRINDAQRNQIIRIAQNKRNEAASKINNERAKFKSISTKQNIDPTLVVFGDDLDDKIDLTRPITGNAPSIPKTVQELVQTGIDYRTNSAGAVIYLGKDDSGNPAWIPLGQ